MKDKEITRLKARLEKLDPAVNEEDRPSQKAAPKKAAPKKDAEKKATAPKRGRKSKAE